MIANSSKDKRTSPDIIKNFVTYKNSIKKNEKSSAVK